MPHTWFVTGSSTGFGRVTVEKALTRGDRVVATLRTPSQLSALREEYSAEQLLILPLDVTSTTSVREAFNKTREAFGHVDIVLSNAGITMGTGEAESVDEDTARRVMETNFWGSRNVALEAIKFFRDTNQPQGGLLLGVSSTLGVVALPAASYYSAAKSALEGFYDALAKEMDPRWSIKIHALVSGGFDTPINKEHAFIHPIHSAYTSLEPSHPVAQLRTYMAQTKEGTLNYPIPKPEVFVDSLFVVVEKIHGAGDLPFRIPIGLDSLQTFKTKAAALSNATEIYAGLTANVSPST